MGVPNPSEKPSFSDSGIFSKKIPESENGGLEPPIETPIQVKIISLYDGNITFENCFRWLRYQEGIQTWFQTLGLLFGTRILWSLSVVVRLHTGCPSQDSIISSFLLHQRGTNTPNHPKSVGGKMMETVFHFHQHPACASFQTPSALSGFVPGM